MNESEPNAHAPERTSAILQLGCAAAVLIAVKFLSAVEMSFFGGVTFTLFDAWYGQPARIGMLLAAGVTVTQFALRRRAVREGRARWFALVLMFLTIAAGLLLAYGAYRVGFVSPLPDVGVKAKPATYIAVTAGVSLAALGATRAIRFLAADRTGPGAVAEGQRRWVPGAVGVTIFAVGIISGLVLPFIRQDSASEPDFDRADSSASVNRDKIIGKWAITVDFGDPPEPPKNKRGELARKSMYTYMIFDETGTLTVESGADHPDVLEFMKANAPEQVFTAKMKYRLLAGDEVEIFDMPPRGHPGRFGDKERARVRVRIEGPIMTLLEERGSNRLARVTDSPFLGTWVVEWTESLGQQAPDNDAGRMKLTFHPDRATWHFRRPDGWKSLDGTLRFDPTSEPKEIDLSQPNNPDRVALGIYKIEGRTLTISMGAERPKTFEEPSWGKMVLRRE